MELFESRPGFFDQATVGEALNHVVQAALELGGELLPVVALEQPPGKPAIEEIPGKSRQRPGLDSHFGRDPVQLQQGQRDGPGDCRFVRVRFQEQAPRIEPAEQLAHGLSVRHDLQVTVGSHV